MNPVPSLHAALNLYLYVATTPPSLDLTRNSRSTPRSEKLGPSCSTEGGAAALSGCCCCCSFCSLSASPAAAACVLPVAAALLVSWVLLLPEALHGLAVVGLATRRARHAKGRAGPSASRLLGSAAEQALRLCRGG